MTEVIEARPTLKIAPEMLVFKALDSDKPTVISADVGLSAESSVSVLSTHHIPFYSGGKQPLKTLIKVSVPLDTMIKSAFNTECPRQN